MWSDKLRQFDFIRDEDGARTIGPDLVPADFNRPWCELCGEHIFSCQYPSLSWASLDHYAQDYFEVWATKCKRFDERLIEHHEFSDLANDGEGAWIVKTIGTQKYIGYFCSSTG